MERIIKIYELFIFLFNKCKELLLLLIIALFLSSDYYKDRYEEPYWSFNQDDNVEEIISNKELRNGTIIVRPQVYVQYKDTIIFIININDFYLTNTATLANNRESKKNKVYIRDIRWFKRQT